LGTKDVCGVVDRQIADSQLGEVHGNAIKNFVSGKPEQASFPSGAGANV
jgi:hypothetical protein